MPKYRGKRYLVFGQHPLGGGWHEYFVEHDSMKKARVEAWLWLNENYDAHILDQKTDKTVEVKIKK